MGSKICGMHVDVHQDGADRVPEAHSRNAGVPEARDVFHYVVRKLGMCRNFRRPRVGIRKHNYREEEEEVMGRDLDHEICIPCVV